MKEKRAEISQNAKTVLSLLKGSEKPHTAYDILAQLQNSGIKAPQTIYRALDELSERGLVHRIQSLGAFIACHSEEEEHGTQFAVCNKCSKVVELHDHRICEFIQEIGKNIGFKIEREMLEVIGVCEDCKNAG